jgi:hypothetical protein
MSENKYCYQGGVVTKYGRVWSINIYGTMDGAIWDAKKLAAKHEGTPIVEYWPKKEWKRGIS